MDEKMTDILWKRLDTLEGKIDSLLEFKWKSVGALLVLTVIFQLMLAFIEKQ